MMQPKLSKEKRRKINKQWILKKRKNGTTLTTSSDISMVKCVRTLSQVTVGQVSLPGV